MAGKAKRSESNNKMYFAISAAIVLFAVVFVIIARSVSKNSDPAQTDAQTGGTAVRTEQTSGEAIPAQSTGTTSLPGTTPATESAPAATDKVTDKATEKQTESAGDATESETDEKAPVTEKPPVDPDSYTGVAYSGAADISVLSKAVLIGDSRTKGLPIYTPIMTTGARVYANEGLSLANIETSEFVTVGENKVTALDALRADTDYDSVYLSLGINEIGLDLAYIDSWINRFADLIGTIRAINPEAQIYIQAILPVSEEKSASNDVFTKERIDTFNAHLLELAKRVGVNYLNTDEMFTEFGGYLPPEGDAGDGIHVNKAYSEKWLTYMAEHRA